VRLALFVSRGQMNIEDFIREQPDVVAAAIAAANERACTIKPNRPTLLIGSGSSFNALTVAAAASASAIGKRPRVVGPRSFLSSFEQGEAGTSGLVIVLSQSGASATTVSAARVAAKIADVFVVTGDARSPIASLSLPSLVAPIGPEPIGPKTKGFTATLAILLTLLAHHEGCPVPGFEPMVFAGLIEDAQSSASALAVTLDALDYLVVSGEGRFYGIALEASLKVAEIAGLPTAAFETEELLHGRLHGLGPNSLVIMIASNGSEVEAAKATAIAMTKRGVRVLVLNLTASPTPYDWMRFQAASFGVLDTLCAIAPFQWLAVRLAQRRGFPPEAMRYPGLSADLAIKLKII
jgi:fructoselysine-6-P-deglycase FrlB-like protein